MSAHTHTHTHHNGMHANCYYLVYNYYYGGGGDILLGSSMKSMQITCQNHTQKRKVHHKEGLNITLPQLSSK